MKPLKLLLESLEFSERLSQKLCQGEVKDKEITNSKNAQKETDEGLTSGEE